MAPPKSCPGEPSRGSLVWILIEEVSVILILAKFVPEMNESLGSSEEGGRWWCEGVE